MFYFCHKEILCKLPRNEKFSWRKATIYLTTLHLNYPNDSFYAKLRINIFEFSYPHSKHVSLIVFLKVLLTFIVIQAEPHFYKNFIMETMAHTISFFYFITIGKLSSRSSTIKQSLCCCTCRQWQNKVERALGSMKNK